MHVRSDMITLFMCVTYTSTTGVHAMDFGGSLFQVVVWQETIHKLQGGCIGTPRTEVKTYSITDKPFTNSYMHG